MSDALLEVHGLEVSVETESGPLVLVDGFDLELGRGEGLGIVGESGCGKTTALLAILRLLPEGFRVRTGAGRAIRFRGRELGLLSERALCSIRGREIGVVFQEPTSSLNPVIQVGEQVAEVLRLHLSLGRRAAWRRAVELLEEVGIEDAARRARSYPHQFSGGMNQRVAIAMAIACEPALLVADEPTSALDVVMQREILALFTRLCAERDMALLLVSHDLAVVLDQTRRVAVMYAGRIVEEGPVRELLGAPAHPYTRGLIRALPQRAVVGRGFPVLAGSVPRAGIWPDGCRFEPRCPRASERCAREMPELCAVTGLPGDGRRAACHHPHDGAIALEGGSR